MEIACWIVAGLALAHLAAGAQKATRSQAQLVEAGIVWAGDFPPRARILIVPHGSCPG